MAVSEIFSLLDGVFVDWDGWYGDQCVDWAQIVNKSYGAPALTGAAAKDIWNTYPQSHYTRIPNGATNFPSEGDIVIWGTGIGPAGHIAVARKGCTSMLLKTMDQNFPTGSRVHSVDHNYKGCLGWLRRK